MCDKPETPPKQLTELQQAKLAKGMGARVHLRGLEIIVVAGDMNALKVAWSRLVPDLDIIESRCQPAIVIAENDWLESDKMSQLQAENAKMREALEAIAHDPNDAQRRADDALA